MLHMTCSYSFSQTLFFLQQHFFNIRHEKKCIFHTHFLLKISSQKYCGCLTWLKHIYFRFCFSFSVFFFKSCMSTFVQENYTGLSGIRFKTSNYFFCDCVTFIWITWSFLLDFALLIFLYSCWGYNHLLILLQTLIDIETAGRKEEGGVDMTVQQCCSHKTTVSLFLLCLLFFSNQKL